MRTKKAKIAKQRRKKIVVIEVLGGVATVTKCPRKVAVKIIDHDLDTAA